MKNLYLTLILMAISLVIGAQEYSLVSNGHSNRSKSILDYSYISYFTWDVLEYDELKYREFLKMAKKSEEVFQVGEQIFTKKELTKLIRKGARRSENTNEFEQFLCKKNEFFANYFSEVEMSFLFLKFGEGTLHRYIDNLAINF